MELSKENKYVIECFQKNFPKSRYERVVIYGIGINTRAILSADTGNVVGLMDASSVGETIMGYPVLTGQEAVSKGECIVIVARNSVVPIIFERIKYLEEQAEFPIYNLSGERIIQKQTTKYENDNPYWEKNEVDLLQRISEHQTISFDIFDTLITRRCMLPADIFFMAEAELRESGIPSEGFVTARREAEMELVNRFPKIDEIYDHLQTKMDWSDSDKAAAIKTELKLERENVIPRRFMRDIYRKVLEMGKTVILVSDMYLPSEIIVELLDRCDIRGYDRLYVSCEEKADKRTGTLFEKVIEDGYTDILHIGDNEAYDGVAAKQCGIHSYTILSAYEMLLQSSLRGLLAHADTLEKRCVAGILQSYLFDNPFSLSADKGVVAVRDNYTVGYAFMAPIIRCFMSFFIEDMRKHKPDKILFSARDGYVIQQIYERMIDEESAKVPKAIYFKTSRRAITVASIKDTQDILMILQKPYNTTMGELLTMRFGVEPNEGDSDAVKPAVSAKNAKETENYIMRYQDKILRNAKEERECYCRYIQKNYIASEKNEKFTVYDFYASGTIQYYLNRLLDGDCRGIYFSLTSLPNMYFEDDSCVSSFFGAISPYDTKYYMNRSYMFAEAILTDGNGSLIRFDNDGEPVYDETENNRRDYNAIRQIQQGILDYCEDTLHDKWFDNYDSMKEYADSIFGMLFQPELCNVSENVRNSVKLENKYEFMNAFSVWKAES